MAQWLAERAARSAPGLGGLLCSCAAGLDGVGVKTYVPVQSGMQEVHAVLRGCTIYDERMYNLCVANVQSMLSGCTICAERMYNLC